MKAYILLMAAAVIISSCKSRQVALEKTHQKLQLDSTGISKKQSSSLDTTQRRIIKKQLTSDSSRVKVTIEADSGSESQLHVNPDGSMDYKGKARHFIVEGKKHHHDDQHKTTEVKSGKTTKQKQIEQTDLHKKLDNTGKNKTVKSSIDWGKTIELCCLVALLLVAAYLIIKRFNLFSKILKLL